MSEPLLPPYMVDELRERDRLWCMALVAVLGTDEVACVLEQFNLLRGEHEQA